MVPLGALRDRARNASARCCLMRYNMYPAAAVNLAAAAGRQFRPGD